jgi:hypothetical protein
MMISYPQSGCFRLQASRIGAIVLLAAAMHLAGCQDEPVVDASQRMHVVTLSPEDASVIHANRFDDFRAALLHVRAKQSQRPDPVAHAPTAVELATFNTELEAVMVAAVTIMRSETWSHDDRQVMNRAMRSATALQLQQP